MVFHAGIGFKLCILFIFGTTEAKLQLLHNNMDRDNTQLADYTRSIRHKRAAHFIGSAVIKGMKVVKILKTGAKQLPFPYTKRYIRKYEKPGGIERLKEDFKTFKYDETRDFRLKNGKWGVMGSVGDRVLFAMPSGTRGKPTLQIVKAIDLDKHLRNEQNVLPRDEIIYTYGE